MTPVTVLIQAKDHLTQVFTGISSKVKSWSSGMRGMIAGAFSVGAITKLGMDAIATAERIGQLKDATDLTTDQVQALGYAAQSANMSAEQFSGMIVHLVDAQKKAVDGNEDLTATFAKLGISLSELQSLKADQLIERVAAAISALRGSNDAMTAATDLFGTKMGVKAIDVLSQVAGGFDAVIAAGRDAGMISMQGTVEEVQRLDAEVDRLKAKLSGMAITGLGKAAEGIKAVAKAAGEANSKEGFWSRLFRGADTSKGESPAFVPGDKPGRYRSNIRAWFASKVVGGTVPEPTAPYTPEEGRAVVEERVNTELEETDRLVASVESRKRAMAEQELSALEQVRAIEEQIADLKSDQAHTVSLKGYYEIESKILDLTARKAKLQKAADQEEKKAADEVLKKKKTELAAEKESAQDALDTARKTAKEYEKLADKYEAAAAKHEAKMPNLRTLAVGSSADRRSLLSELKAQAKEQRKLERMADRAEDKEWGNQQRGALKRGLTSREKAALEWAREAEETARGEAKAKDLRGKADEALEKANQHLESIDDKIQKAISLS